MASNLSTIGFVFPDQEQFQSAMLGCAAAAGARLPCDDGEYGIWRSATGAEVWFHLGRSENGETEIHGLSPFFEGRSEVRMLISNAVHRQGENVFEGAFHGWVNPDETGKGSYPLLFDAVDFSSRVAIPLPSVHRIRIAAFARELSAYKNDADFLAAQTESDGLKFAGQAFIPTGLFVAAQDAAENAQSAAPEPASTALLTGTVLDHCLLRNETSGRDFHWLLVETLDKQVVDVVADPVVVKGDIVEGGTIETSSLLFGRFLD